MKTVDVLSGHDLALNDDGEFEISVDGTPRNGRRNHIQSSPAAREFYIRDVIHDWARDRANLLTIERLGGPAAPPALSDEEQVALTASFMRKYADKRCREPQSSATVNSFALPSIATRWRAAPRSTSWASSSSPMTRRWSSRQLGGAKYVIAPITNIWGTTNEIVRLHGWPQHRAEQVQRRWYVYVRREPRGSGVPTGSTRTTSTTV